MSKLCCNNNLCNPDSHVENMTEVRKASYNKEMMNSKKGNAGVRRGSDNGSESVEILSNEGKRTELAKSLQIHEKLKSLDDVVETAPRLEITVLSSANLNKGDAFIINAKGLESETPHRQAYDGVTYFGRKKNVKLVQPG